MLIEEKAIGNGPLQKKHWIHKKNWVQIKPQMPKEGSAKEILKQHVMKCKYRTNKFLKILCQQKRYPIRNVGSTFWKKTLD